jgi:hypothetical protein
MDRNTLRFTRLVAAIALSSLLIAGCKRDQVTTQPDGTQTVVKADGTQIATHPDGSQTVTKPDGTQTVVAANGGVSTQAANGAQTVVQPNGATTTTAPDGSQVTTQPGGATPASNPYAVQPAQSSGGVPAAGTAQSNNASVAPLMVPAGTALNIRLNQHISVKSSHAGDQFTGTVVNPVVVNGNVAIPDGSRVTGVVTNAHRRGHFKGASVLQLRLTALDLPNGGHYALDSKRVTKTKKGKGKRSFGIIGGGTGLGMLVGGLATGGVGLVVGGLAGAGGGTAIAGLTGNRDIDYPAESVITFRLADAIDIR